MKGSKIYSFFSKFISGLIFFIFLFTVGPSVDAMDIHGGFSSSFSYFVLNNDSLLADNQANLSTFIGGNLYFQSRDRDLIQYYLDLSFEGSYAGSKNPSTSRIKLAPVDLGVNQLYVMVPFSHRSFVYLGKKLKEFGVANFFNISNQISPKYMTDYDFSRKAPGLIEWHRIHSFNFTYGLMLNFQDARRWDETQLTTFFDSRWQDLSVEGYLYYQPDQKDHALALNSIYQWGDYQFYIESILKGKAEQWILSDDLSASLKRRALEDYLNLVLGTSVSFDDFEVSLEYLYRHEGLDQQEQEEFINYLGSVPLDVRMGTIGDYYSANALLQNYLAFSFSMSPFLVNDLSFDLSTLLSFQPEIDRFEDYASYRITTKLGYALTQNLGINLGYRYQGGGEWGEYSRLQSQRSLYSFSIAYAF